MPMSRFRKALRLAEKANQHMFRNPYGKLPKDDHYEFKVDTFRMIEKERKQQRSFKKHYK